MRKISSALLLLLLSAYLLWGQAEIYQRKDDTIEDISAKEEIWVSAENAADRAVANFPHIENESILHSLLTSELEPRYEIIERTYSDKDSRFIEISYPELNTKESIDIADVNEAVREEAFNYQLETIGLTFSQDYSIALLSDTKYSVVFEATPYVQGAAHPVDICHAITIDLTSGNKQSLADVVKSYDELEEYIVNGNYKVKGSLCVYEKDRLWKQIQIMYACVDIDTHLNDFFINSDGEICLIISGLGHGAGDYSIVQVQRNIFEHTGAVPPC